MAWGRYDFCPGRQRALLAAARHDFVQSLVILLEGQLGLGHAIWNAAVDTAIGPRRVRRASHVHAEFEAPQLYTFSHVLGVKVLPLSCGRDV